LKLVLFRFEIYTFALNDNYMSSTYMFSNYLCLQFHPSSLVGLSLNQSASCSPRNVFLPLVLFPFEILVYVIFMVVNCDRRRFIVIEKTLKILDVSKSRYLELFFFEV
jgi:hypothetical protein